MPKTIVEKKETKNEERMTRTKMVIEEDAETRIECIEWGDEHLKLASQRGEQGAWQFGSLAVGSLAVGSWQWALGIRQPLQR